MEKHNECFLVYTWVHADRLSIIAYMYPALFLDRDGVIIENRSDYVCSWSDVSIYPQALEALRKIKSCAYKIVIITNQSPVGRGMISLQAAERINSQLIKEIESAGGRVDGVFMCPHSPEDHCSCRKPLPGLILDAAASLSLDLSRSILIGDALSDIKAGQAAGVGQNILVLTGRGRNQSSLPDVSNLPPFLIFDTLADALEELIPSIGD